jgi:uncharacterized protein
MRRLLPLVLLAAAVLAAAALAGIGRPEAARGETATPDTVTTLGHGLITIAPDEATVSAGVHTQAASASAALAENAKLMNAVVAALKAAGGGQLQTQQVSLYPQTGPQGDVTAYVADNSVSAKTKIAGAGALIDAAVGAGANTVNGPNLGVSDRDARYRDALAKAGGFGVGPVSSVTEQGGSGPPQVFQAIGAAAKDATPIEPGTQEVTADVTVTFRIR